MPVYYVPCYIIYCYVKYHPSLSARTLPTVLGIRLGCYVLSHNMYQYVQALKQGHRGAVMMIMLQTNLLLYLQLDPQSVPCYNHKVNVCCSFASIGKRMVSMYYRPFRPIS